MKGRELASLLSLSAILGAATGLQADTKDNPYQDIVARNAFALKPPPPPPPPGSETPPPTSVDVLLTGISTLGGTKKVLLQIVEKGPNKKPEYPPPLCEKDIQGRIEVVSIDADKGAVMIKIDGNEKTLTFEKDSPKAASAAPPPGPGGAPGHLRPNMPMNPAGTIPLPGVTTAAGAAAAANPNAGTGAYGVVVGGAASGVPAPAAGSPALGGLNALSAGLPARPVRTTVDGAGGVYVGGAGTATAPRAGGSGVPAAQTPALSREQAILHIEEQRRLIKEATDLGLVPKNRFAPLPTTPLTPRAPTPVPQQQ